MLVLSRKEGQRIQIGEDTWVIVGKIKGNRVCLGIEAPNAVAIRRTELVRQSTRLHQRPPPRELKKFAWHSHHVALEASISRPSDNLSVRKPGA